MLLLVSKKNWTQSSCSRLTSTLLSAPFSPHKSYSRSHMLHQIHSKFFPVLNHAGLLNKVDTLYASLNVHDKFPELKGVNREFVQILLMACDLKINIHKRAIGSFFEWDKLDHAVSGKEKHLVCFGANPFSSYPSTDTIAGTKLHQQTHKAITKRQPALMASIRKSNQYCQRLHELHDSSIIIPIPSPLSMKLNDLRNDPTLLEDVWISPCIGEAPQWLEDPEARDGIRALLKRDQCQEEQCRLGRDADNMCRWFGRELTATELALQQPWCMSSIRACFDKLNQPTDSVYGSLLRQRRESIQNLQDRWPNVLASPAHYSSQA